MKTKVIYLLAAVPLLALLNLAATRSLLGLESGESHFRRVKGVIPPVGRVLFFASSGFHGDQADSFEWIADRLDFSAKLPEKGGDESATEIPLDRLAALNPYPPLLWGTASQYAESLSYLSLGYVDPAGTPFQYSYYCGESDTTPSWVVPKTRRTPGDGDYFVCYSVLLDLSGEAPVVRSTLWRAYRGGSYNGFEEIMLFGVFSFVEALLLFAGWAFQWRTDRHDSTRITV